MVWAHTAALGVVYGGGNYVATQALSVSGSKSRVRDATGYL